MRRAWCRQEVDAAVEEYLGMLALELGGEQYNKAERNRRLRTRLTERSKGAVERKHQNISAVLIELGFPYIPGYKPLGNVQAMLREAVREQLPRLANLVAEHVSAPQPQLAVDDVLGIRVEVPARPERLSVGEERPTYFDSGRVNYLQREALNQSLGDAGEALVVRYEQARLRHAGKDRLARNVEQVSKTIGDHAGYDIRSYEISGRDRFVEVKTTRYGPFTPFYISTGELRFSQEHPCAYRLYRVFEFVRRPKLFTLAGDVARHVRLQATHYRAQF